VTLTQSEVLDLPPLLFAGVILEGGIVGFDSNTLTGGIGARFLGIGGDVEYRQNTVTVNLRAVSVKTGEVLANVTVEKTLAAVGLSAGAFKFIDFDKLIEAEAGITNNEPGTMAVRRAVERAVYAIIVEGSQSGLWAFSDKAIGARLLQEYRDETRTQVARTPRLDGAFSRPVTPADRRAGGCYESRRDPRRRDQGIAAPIRQLTTF